LAHLPKELSLVVVVAAQLVIAFFGYNLVQAFERYAFPILAAIFVVASVIVLSKAHPGMPAFTKGEPPPLGGFLITVGASFGYAAGWNPYASDYTRYLAPETNPAAVALWSGLGLFVSCAFLEIAGAAIVTGGQTNVDPSSFTALLPTAVGKLTLLAICLGAISANVLNVYSGAMSFMALGLRVGAARARAIVAVVFGCIGFVVASFGLKNAGTDYENFLLIISYWIAPWLGVVFVDRWRRRGQPIGVVAQDRRHRNWAGPVSMFVAGSISIWLFSNQTKYVGLVPSHHPAVGDLTAEVGFALAAGIYFVVDAVLRQLGTDTQRHPTAGHRRSGV
jgi:purine-cytosine permease-like protein